MRGRKRQGEIERPREKRKKQRRYIYRERKMKRFFELLRAHKLINH